MAGTVEKIRIAESDVLRASGHLPPNILQHHVALHHAEYAAIHRNHRAMPAKVLAASAGFGVPGKAADSAMGNKLGIGV